LLGAVVALFFGLLVYVQDRTAPSSLLFLGVAFSVTFLSFSVFAYRQAEASDVAWVWIRVSSFWPFLHAITFHYALVFTGYAGLLRSRPVVLGNYAVAAAITAVGLFTNVFSDGPLLRWWGWAPGVPDGSIPFYLSTGWTLCIVATTFVVILVQRVRSSDSRMRAQLKFLLIGYSLPIISWMVSNVFLALAGVSAPDMSAPIFAVGVGFFVYGLKRHQLFVLTPRAVSHEILETMSDAVLLIDTRQRVVSVNRAATRLLEMDMESVMGQPLSRFFPSGAPVLIGDAGGAAQYTEGSGEFRDGDTVITTGSRKRIPVSLAVTTLRSEDGQELGAVLAARDATDRKDMEARVLQLEDLRREQSLRDAKEEERKRLAEELHDQTLMELAGLAIEVGFIEREATDPSSAETQLRELRSRIHETEAGLRDILKGLYPDVLTNLGLVAAVRSYLVSLTTLPFEGDGPLEIRFRARGFGEERPPDLTELTAYRLVQQSVFNSIRHGRPTTVEVTLGWQGDRLTVEVVDDGVGFSPVSAERLRANGHHGIANLHDRVEAVGGVLNVDSSPGNGARIGASIPTGSAQAVEWLLEVGTYRIEPTE
jgi:PAS domain S-box-containing protein